MINLFIHAAARVYDYSFILEAKVHLDSVLDSKMAKVQNEGATCTGTCV